MNNTNEVKSNATIKSLEKQLKEEKEARLKMESNIDDLLKVASKRKLEKLKKAPEAGKFCRISVYKGQVVKSWKTLTNISESGSGGNRVDQTMEITMMDDTTAKLPTEIFLKNGLEKVEVEIKGKATRDGITTYTVEYLDKEYEIVDTFLN